MARSAAAHTSELLAGMALFSTCSKRELAQIAALCVPDTLPAGSVLTREGAAGGIAYIVVSGQAEVLRSGRRLAVLGPGDVVGELSLIDQQPRSATVRAVSDVEILQLDALDFNRMLQKVPEVGRKLLSALASRLRQTEALPVGGL